MVEVSDNFKELAAKNGRSVYCRIYAGNELFLDDRIIEFDFDDVTHPDWYTIGTTCANRFSFSVRYSGGLQVHDVVKPYISFDNEEWCPLGVFYVSRRYVRGKYSSIICYDKMYSLDKEYSAAIELPTTMDVLMRDLCDHAEIECEDAGRPYKIQKIPANSTIRDLMGYVASMNYSCAKINREGRLVLKRYVQMPKSYISVNNCTDYSRNMSQSRIKRVVIDTGEQTFDNGNGSELETVELYNPFMTADRAEDLMKLFKPFYFYGADVEMQGMPFLESGEFVWLVENSETKYALVISEVEYHYDGALTATLHSKNRNYTDAAVHMGDLEAALNEIRSSLGNIYLKKTNGAELSIGTSMVTVADFEFETRKQNTFAQIDVNFTLDSDANRTLYINLYVNGKKADRKAVHQTTADRRGLLHYYYLAEELPKGKNSIVVRFQTSSGTVSIEQDQLIATMIGKGMEGGGEGSVRDRQTGFEELPFYTIKSNAFTVAEIFGSFSESVTEDGG